ncbi:MAG: hypothetical protein WCT32_03185 [Patescibacteria group bacterium]
MSNDQNEQTGVPNDNTDHVADLNLADDADLDMEILPDDGGVKVGGVWYSSLQSYFEKREEELKKRAAGGSGGQDQAK